MPSTLGAVIYAVRWPNPVAQVFGFHEVFHVFVLAGSLTHFVFMMRLRSAWGVGAATSAHHSGSVAVTRK
ncbi:MAG: hemolysin III family protein [Deltaproteobacteria bacterium]|nr:MAG: hemolysin III family protein [Deltaproteobacteria bacterium]